MHAGQVYSKICFSMFYTSFDRECVADHEYLFPDFQNTFLAEIFAKYLECLKNIQTATFW